MLDALIVFLWECLAVLLFGMLTGLLIAIVYLIVRMIVEEIR